MTLDQKRWIIAILGFIFLGSLLIVQKREVDRRRQEAGLADHHISVPAASKECVECHEEASPAIIDHWEGSNHALSGVACVDCHTANQGEADAFTHYGELIATVVTPLDCGRCHPEEQAEFASSHHAAAGKILHSLDNRLAEIVEGMRGRFEPHSPTPGMERPFVEGLASVSSGCWQCHGSQVALMSKDGGILTSGEFAPNEEGMPSNADAVYQVKKDNDGKPVFDPRTWPNTGIGRINLDGSSGSCSACHSRHDFSPRRARQPENCGKCHLGPDHPQKEIYEESKHGAAFRDLKDQMNLDSDSWVLGEDYTAAPTCATCHMSANTRNGRKITHDPGERLSWNNRPPISLVYDTDADGNIIKEKDPVKRREMTVDTAEQKRERMVQVCTHCHSDDYVDNFYAQYDNLVTLYNEKFAKAGTKIMTVLLDQGLRSKPAFDEEIEWTWFYLWHHEGRRARHGASMMAPDYTHWHGMYEVAERFYMELIPQAREMAEEARDHGQASKAHAVEQVIDEILARPEHQWQAEAQATLR